MTARIAADTNDKIQSLVAGATGGAALYHYSSALGLGIDKDIIGHVAPLISFLIGWIWVVVYQETFGRFNIYRLKKAVKRRIVEIDEQLNDGVIGGDRRKKLIKERDDCLDIIAKASAHDLRKRLNFSISN
jgi:hypothetical protein